MNLDMNTPAAPDGESSETHELYSWNARHRGWVAISQGSEEEMTAQEAVRYHVAKATNIAGAAFWVGEVDDGAPGLAPEDLGIEVTGTTGEG